MQKAVKIVSIAQGNNGRIDVLHTNLDGSTYKPGTPDKVGYLASHIDADSLAVLQSLSPGDIATITLTKEGNFWNLTKTEKGNTVQQKQGGKKQYDKKPFDDVGIKVGASRNQAIAFLAATKGAKFTLDDVDTVAYEIVKRQAAQEAHVRTGADPVIEKNNIAEQTLQAQQSISDDAFFTQ